MPPTLLNLSRELRDLIYAEVLDNGLSPPQSEEDLQANQTQLDWVCNLGRCPLSCDLPVRITTPPLLLVNRQIHAEASHSIALARTNNTGLRYKLDCVILNEERINLTWLSVPARSTRVDELEARFRLYGDADGWYSAWHEGDGWGCRMMKSLYSLLRQFLECGPGFSTPRPGGVEVGLLVLNVITPSSLHMGWLVPGERPPPGEKESAPYLQWQNEVRVSPERVVGIMGDDIGGFLVPFDSRTSLIYGKIGHISIRLDGKEKKAFDLVTMKKLASDRSYRNTRQQA